MGVQTSLHALLNILIKGICRSASRSPLSAQAPAAPCPMVLPWRPARLFRLRSSPTIDSSQAQNQLSPFRFAVLCLAQRLSIYLGLTPPLRLAFAGSLLHTIPHSQMDLPNLITEFDESLWASLVDSMTVYAKDRIVFRLTCGLEIEA